MSVPSPSSIDTVDAFCSRLSTIAAVLVLSLGIACTKQRDPEQPAASEPPISASTNSCQQRISQWMQLQAAVTSDNVAERIGQLRGAALQLGDDPEGCASGLIDSALDDELRKVLVLKSAGREFTAGVVYSCRELREGTKCVGRIADDTAHLGEALDTAPALPAASEVLISMSPDYRIASLQWYRARDRALLDDANAAVPITPSPNATLSLPAEGESNVLFAIGQGPAGELHKWVWLVRQ